MANKSNRRSKGVSLYTNLAARRRANADVKARRKAEYLASLPKNPVKRLLYRLHPKRVFKFWFSKQGAITALKLAGVGLVIFAIFIAALFAYYRRELDAIRPSELAKRVTTTVTRYYDRNNILLWEDKGDGDYKLVIESKDVAKVMKDATIAIEDKDFYSHGGVSVQGIIRASLNNFSGSGNTQGASTLTQQLIKQVFFAEDVAKNRLSISRKIKEIILAIEVERMYNKDQILTLYLNEVPYGGRRNGVESAALTYFGKHAKDVNLAEAALLASIPQNPSYYNPYTLDPDSSKELILRQHSVIDKMLEQGFIKKDQAEEAKKYPILDSVKPELAGTENIKAPHFVLEVRSQLEKEFSTKVVRSGGLNVKTTLDWRIQEMAENSVRKNDKAVRANGSDDIAVTSVDVPTGQILAMVGSIGFNTPVYGATNAAVASLQPGSSVKPFFYANLFKQRDGQNFGAGTVLADENIDALYRSKLRNFDGNFFGAITIREALGNSRNPPAVKAAYITGIDSGVQTARDAGDKIYCQGIQYGLSAAIGSCNVKQVEHTNAFATLARQGIYKPESYVLEVKNAQGQTLKQWKDESKRVLDSQITYILSDIMSDPNARSRVFGTRTPGMNIPGVKTATKTGTTDDGHEHAKEGWMMSYSPRMATGIWVGRHDGKPIAFPSNQATGNVMQDVMGKAHKELFEKDGSWKSNDWFTQPPGVQRLTVDGKTDLFPSWYIKPAAPEKQKVAFDKVSKKKATSCTPERAKVELEVQVYEDPVTKAKTQSAPDGYNSKEDDDFHKCDDVKPFVTLSTTSLGEQKYRITATVSQGTHALSSVDITVEGQVVSSQPVGSAGAYTVEHTFTSSGSKSISATVIDQGFYDGSDTESLNVVSSRGNKKDQNEDVVLRPLRRRQGG